MKRTLALTTPHMTGDDVKYAQNLLKRAGYYKGESGGEFGPLTAQACFRAKYWLGYATPDQTFGSALEKLLLGKTQPTSDAKKRIALRKKRADDASNKMRMYTSVHEDNPYLCNPDGTWTDAGTDYLAFLDSLTGVRRLRYRDGLWAAAEGLVFDDWRDNVNAIEWFPIPKDWPLILSVDFGYSNPFVCQWWRVDLDGRMYLTREIHQTQTLVEDHAKRIKEILAENRDAEGMPVAVVCDHDAEDRATLTKHLGLPTVAARKGVSRGVQLMQARMRQAGDGKPRLYVFRGCVLGRDLVGEQQKRPRGFLGEVNGYVWAVERGPDGIPKEVPLKLHDHAMDAGRYAVAYLDWNEPARKHNPAAARPEAAQQQGSRWARPVGR